ncbi:MAG TPA: fibronectin type III domain-containing protein [Chthoniobacterales bacterium]|jgi:hypothetical protein
MKFDSSLIWFVVLSFLCVSLVPVKAATSATLYWDKNSEQNIAGYRVRYGPPSDPDAHLLSVKTNTASVPGLIAGTTYTFSVSAYNTEGVESLYSNPIAYTVPSGGSGQMVTLDNISSRGFVQTGENVMIGGFIIQSSTPKTVVLRALGPSLAQEGVAGTLSDPVLELHDASGKLIASNDSWSSGNAATLTALGLAPTAPSEAALVATLPAGAYSAVVHGKGSAQGVALFELYNLDRTQGSVANISTRSNVETGDRVLIGGFIVGGATATKVIVRAIGPSLAASGVLGALQDPTLDLYNGDGDLLSSNDNWRSDQEQAIVDSKVPPSDDRESAIVETLPPGNYSAVVQGKNNSTGVALFEVYALSQ